MADHPLPTWGRRMRAASRWSSPVWALGLVLTIWFDAARWIAVIGFSGVVLFGVAWLAAEARAGYTSPRPPRSSTKR